MRHIVITLSIISLLAGVLANPQDVQAAHPQDVEKVVQALYAPNLKSAIFRDYPWDYPGAGVLVVFIADGLRYSLYHKHPHGKGSYDRLTVWVRKNGTHNKEKLERFSDHGTDGSVDFGINGRDETDEKPQFFGSPSFLDSSATKGAQHRKYWQKAYDAAIARALERLRAE